MVCLGTVTEEGIELYEEIVLMSTKGEAIAVGIAQVGQVAALLYTAADSV